MKDKPALSIVRWLELDYHMGKVFNYLNSTEDPRWPGHKLAENTYVIFTSDNGGMEGHPGEVITTTTPWIREKYPRWRVVSGCL